MKLNTVTKPIQSAGMSVKVGFNIDMNGKAFNVLSSGMYSDIVSTIVRELSSNAYDSHVAAGIADQPFEVSCPSAFDPHFSVKDFGTGLRYFKYTATIVNEHDGESTAFIDGDIREEIEGITMIVLDGTETANIGAILYDNTNNQTVLRIPVNFEGKNVSVEFDDTLVLYSTYFRSTKEQSNDFTGAFGLGSKTPLAYTDNFIVTNRYNGTMRVYNILTNEQGLPQINLMMSSETDEGNGLEVKLAVAPDDYRDFRDAIVSQLKYFDPLPIILNDEVTFPTLVHKGEHFMLFENLGCHSYRTGHACVGNNAYEISHLTNNLFHHNMVVRFAIGEVMVTASREDLKYDEDTISMINEREEQAVEEYTTYVLNSLDCDNMDSYEKAIFINRHSSVLDLSSDEVRQKVGNPNFMYYRNSIRLPITGWGDYSRIEWIDKVDETTGDTIKVIHGRHFLTECNSWSKYDRKKCRTVRNNSSIWIDPTENLLVFIRDNSYSFLKKIGYYLENNPVDHDVEIFTLDRWNDDYLAMIQEVAGDYMTLVYLSSIELPKNISTVAYGSNTTPVARLYKYGENSFSSTKYWDDVFTPLTKIDTDAYIVETHRNEIENLSYEDQRFMDMYLGSRMPFDSNITILSLSRARYEKALEYGFKPIKELVAKLKKNVVIPVNMVNSEKINAMLNVLECDSILNLFTGLKNDVFEKLDADSPIRKLIRTKYVASKWINSRKKDFRTLKRLSDFMGDTEKPEVSEFVKNTLDITKEMLDNVHTELTLLSALRTWGLEDDQKEAMIRYTNMMFNTGEDNE